MSAAAHRSVVPFVSALCLSMGIVQLLDHDALWVLWCSMITLTVIGFWGLGRLIFVAEFVTAWSVYGVSLALAYGFGALNTFTSGYIEGLSILNVTYASFSGIGRAQGAVLLLVSALLFIGHIDSHKLIPRQSFNSKDRQAVLLVLAMVLLGTVLALATGQLGFQGVQTGEDNTALVSPLASLMASTITPVLGLTALVFSNQPASRQRTLALAMGLLLILIMMTQGRRPFLFNMITVFIAFFCTRGIRDLITPKAVIILVVGVLCALGMSRFYLATRTASYTLPASATLMDRLEAGVDALQRPQVYDLDEAVRENQSTRTFVVGYLAELIEAIDATDRSTQGDLLMLNVATAVPTSIWPGKWRVIYQVGSDEIACHAKLGLPAWDAANSILTEGLCDFKWPGLLLYPLAMAAMMTLANLAVRRAPLIVRGLVCFATIGGLLHVEGVLTGYIVGLRNIALMAAVTWSLHVFFQFYSQLPLVKYMRQAQANRRAQQLGDGLR